MGEPVLAWLMAPEAPELGTLELLLHRPEWHRRAACRGMAVEVFFPAAGELSDAALQTCGRCPVAGECRDYALASSTAPAGVWGGLHAVQLRQLRLRLRLQRRAG